MGKHETISLPPDLAAQLAARVESGEASDAAEVVRAALVALDAEDARRLDAVRAKVAAALADERPSRPADEVFDRVRSMIASLKDG